MQWTSLSGSFSFILHLSDAHGNDDDYDDEDDDDDDESLYRFFYDFTPTQRNTTLEIIVHIF